MADRILYLFPDTNLFIQCSPLPEIGWTRWDDFDQVRLLVCRPVQREIDNQKNRGNDRVAQRARKTYRMFRDIATSEDGYKVIRESGPRVELHLQALSRPSVELENRLDYSKPDDEIVGYCHEYSREHSGADVRLLTHDGGPMMTARSLGLPFEPIPEDWILPPENSPAERENARLREEVNRLQKAEPEFLIRCVSKQGQEIEKLEFECQVFEPLAEADISELIQALKSRCPISNYFGPNERTRRDTSTGVSPLERIMMPSRAADVFVPASAEEIGGPCSSPHRRRRSPGTATGITQGGSASAGRYSPTCTSPCNEIRVVRRFVFSWRTAGRARAKTRWWISSQGVTSRCRRRGMRWTTNPMQRTERAWNSRFLRSHRKAAGCRLSTRFTGSWTVSFYPILCCIRIG